MIDVPRKLFAGATVLALACSAWAQKSASWPQWRGPQRDGISREKGWSTKGKKDPVWLTTVGMGYSTVSVADGRLYTIGHDPDAQKDTVFCIEADTGLEVWTHTFGAQTMARAHRGGSLTTPSIDGDRVFVSSREGKLFCLDAKTGKVRWSKDLADEYGMRLPTWGFAASPLVLDEMIVVNMRYVFAFKRNGELIWKTDRDYKTSYSTPVTLELDGKQCIADFNGVGLTILERKTGKELAVHEWRTRSGVNAASPVVIGKNKIFISSGYNTGCAMLEVSTDKIEVLWESRVMRNHMSGCVLVDNHLFGYDESVFKCLDLDGNVKWSERLGKAAFLVADDKLLLLTGRGELIIAEANTKEFKEISRTKVLGGGVNWTTPVLCGGRVYCRNSMGDLVCMDHRTGDR